MKYLVAILFLLTGLITEAQQRIVIENLAAVDSAWISGGNLFYRKGGSTFNAGSVGGTAPVTSVFGRTGAVTALVGDYSSFYQPLNLKLTTFSALSNGTGWLYNNGSGTYSWSNPFPSDSSLSINNRILSYSTPTLQSVTDNGFTTTNPLIANYFQLTPSAFSRFVGIDDGGTGALLNLLIRQNVGGSGYSANLRPDSLTNSGVPHNHYLPDTSGNYTVGVKVNGVTYMSRKNGIADLGTIGGSSFPPDSSLSIGNRFLSVNNNLTFINQRLDSVKAVEIDKTLDSLAWVKGTGELKIKSARVTAGSSKVSVTGSGTDSTRQWAVDVNEANLTLNNIGGTLQTSKGGVPTGGNTGQVLKKNSNSDYDYSWQADNTGGAGSSLTTQSVTGTGAIADSIKLVNDAAAPGNNRVYGTNGSGTKGWQQSEVVNKTSVADWDVLAYDNTNGEWDNRTTDSLFKRRYQYSRRVAFDYMNEFINTVATSSAGADVQATNNGTAAATSTQATDATNRVGLVRSTTGSTATGRTYVNSAASAVRLGGGEWKYEIMLNPTTLSNGTERYQLLAGFFDTYTAANQVDGAYFLYDEGGVSTGSTAAAYWQTVTASNSVRTFNTSLTQTTVNAATWVRLTIIVNADATRAEFFINGTNVAVHTGNIPSGSGRELGFGWGLIKSAGTAARTVDIDYLTTQLTFTTARE